MTEIDDVELEKPAANCESSANVVEADTSRGATTAATATTTTATTTPTTTNEKMQKEEEIVNFLSRNEKIIFKSQQIDDPDLTIDEKKSIALNILNENHIRFLSRFGRYLQNEHLDFFEDNSYPENEDYEIKYLLRDLRKDLKNRAQNIKNRRYAAIKVMMKENDYFSEKEMMRREPHLYEQLVGQYLTETEKRIRDGYDPKNTPFSQILLENIDKERTEDLRKKQERDDDDDDDSETMSLNSSYTSEKTFKSISEDVFPKIPPSYRKQWGNFEDDNDEEPSTSKRKPKKEKPQKYITAGEREMLRQEFIGIMHTKFLEGMDKEFDYTKVDDNPELDDINQINQDNEDKYFADDDDDNDGDEGFEGGNVFHMDQDESSEDDLDIYMRHLKKHPNFKGNSQY